MMESCNDINTILAFKPADEEQKKKSIGHNKIKYWIFSSKIWSVTPQTENITKTNLRCEHFQSSFGSSSRSCQSLWASAEVLRSRQIQTTIPSFFSSGLNMQACAATETVALTIIICHVPRLYLAKLIHEFKIFALVINGSLLDSTYTIPVLS